MLSAINASAEVRFRRARSKISASRCRSRKARRVRQAAGPDYRRSRGQPRPLGLSGESPAPLSLPPKPTSCSASPRFTTMASSPIFTPIPGDATVYELKDGKPNLIEFQFKDGVYRSPRCWRRILGHRQEETQLLPPGVMRYERYQSWTLDNLTRSVRQPGPKTGRPTSPASSPEHARRLHHHGIGGVDGRSNCVPAAPGPVTQRRVAPPKTPTAVDPNWARIQDYRDGSETSRRGSWPTSRRN